MALKTKADLHKIIHSWVNATTSVGETLLAWRPNAELLTVGWRWRRRWRRGERRDIKIGWPAMARTATFPRRRQLWLTIKSPHLSSSGNVSQPPNYSVKGILWKIDLTDVDGQTRAKGTERVVTLLPRATLASRAIRAGGAHSRLDRSYKVKLSVFSLRSAPKRTPNTRSFWFNGWPASSKASVKSLSCVFSWYFASSATTSGFVLHFLLLRRRAARKTRSWVRGAERNLRAQLASVYFTANYVLVWSALKTLVFTRKLAYIWTYLINNRSVPVSYYC